MARLVERNGKTYCVEEDGAEWEYSPPEPGVVIPDRIAKLEEENQRLKTDVEDMMTMLAEILFG